jgi:hypothetical protein
VVGSLNYLRRGITVAIRELGPDRAQSISQFRLFDAPSGGRLVPAMREVVVIRRATFVRNWDVFGELHEYITI